MPHQDLNEKHSRYDKDDEFLNFINDNDQKDMEYISMGLGSTNIEIFEEISIKTNPLYCYRSPLPFYILISSNRVKRSISLSRMFKYDATKYFKRESLYLN